MCAWYGETISNVISRPVVWSVTFKHPWWEEFLGAKTGAPCAEKSQCIMWHEHFESSREPPLAWSKSLQLCAFGCAWWKTLLRVSSDPSARNGFVGPLQSPAKPTRPILTGLFFLHGEWYCAWDATSLHPSNKMSDKNTKWRRSLHCLGHYRE